MCAMPAPVTVSVDVAADVVRVFDFLDVLANHEPFNDHLMRDWEVSGPARGVGSRARVRTRALGVSDVVDIEVVEVEAPTRIVERNTAQKAGRVGQGTYALAPLPRRRCPEGVAAIAELDPSPFPVTLR